MRKLFIYICVAFVVISCSGKPKQSPDFLYGSKEYGKFVDYYLKGKPRLAEASFARGEAQFLRMDELCNISRMYIGRFVLDETGEDMSTLDKSKEYAALGNCSSEMEAIKYLSGKKYDKELLPEPYSLIIGADGEKLIKLSESDKLLDYTRTRLLRRAAIGYIVSSPDKAVSAAEEALVLDRFNGYSLNILRDLIIIKSAKEKLGEDTDGIKKRIRLIKAMLDKK